MWKGGKIESKVCIHGMYSILILTSQFVCQFALFKLCMLLMALYRCYPLALNRRFVVLKVARKDCAVELQFGPSDFAPMRSELAFS